MDFLSLIGVSLALATLVGGSILKGSGVEALLSPAAFVIVVLGTIAAILLQTPQKTFRHALKILPWAFRPPRRNPENLIKSILEWSNSARRQGLLALEPALDTEQDPFIKKGLQLLVDGSEPDMIRGALEVEVTQRESLDMAGAKVFEGMGIYSPTLGIIGAVMGLMSVLKNLADPSMLGTGIAAAFVATIYGIGLANLFFLPLAAKLKATIAETVREREMVIEGLIGISLGENPRNIESRLRGFLS